MEKSVFAAKLVLANLGLGLNYNKNLIINQDLNSNKDILYKNQNPSHWIEEPKMHKKRSNHF